MMKSLIGFALAGLCCAMPLATMAQQEESKVSASVSEIVTDNRLGNPEGAVDRLVFFETPDEWNKGAFRNVAVSEATPPRLRLTPGERSRGYPKQGSFTTREFETDFPFTELLPSWNVNSTENSGFTFDVRVRDAASGEWSPYLYLGHWGKNPHSPNRRLDYDKGEVHMDYLKLKEPANAFQVRASFYAYAFNANPEAMPTLRRITVSYSGVVKDPEQRRKLASSVIVDGNWARSLPVPFRTQRDLPPEVSGSTCSPSSTSMVMAYAGADFPTLQNALRIYDDEYGIFGVWSRATALPSEYGLDGWLTRFRNWDQVKTQIAKGQPVVASIRFGAGEFPSNPLKSSGGHLIVIRGFQQDGNIIVNDPAHKDVGNGIVYNKDELAKAWFDKGGVAYIIRKPGLGM
ncbi:C39 family peptidase [Candidatus Sumerlaeota bacterium]|nr:C39 family peptidase [Candidatus Sumerlaeota bacterium]